MYLPSTAFKKILNLNLDFTQFINQPKLPLCSYLEILIPDEGYEDKGNTRHQSTCKTQTSK